MLDHRITVGEYICVIQAHTTLNASDLHHVTRLYEHEIPLWLVLAGLLNPGIEFKALTDALITDKEKA